MPNTIPCSFGDIVLVSFPFTDQTTSKKRPAVVMLKSSLIKPVVATVERHLISRALGSLTATDAAALRAALPAMLG